MDLREVKSAISLLNYQKFKPLALNAGTENYLLVRLFANLQQQSFKALAFKDVVLVA